MEFVSGCIFGSIIVSIILTLGKKYLETKEIEKENLSKLTDIDLKAMTKVRSIEKYRKQKEYILSQLNKALFDAANYGNSTAFLYLKIGCRITKEEKVLIAHDVAAALSGRGTFTVKEDIDWITVSW